MAKVYVVTSGEYGNYGIEEIFSERELAEVHISTHERHKDFLDCHKGYGDEFRIEEYELDRTAKLLRKGLGAWGISGQRAPSGHIHHVCASTSESKVVKENGTKVVVSGSCLFTYCLAQNYGHALKTGRTRFAKYRAEQEGIA